VSYYPGHPAILGGTMRRHFGYFATGGVLVLMLATEFGLAKDKKKIPTAPLPAAIASAKRIFLSNGGGSNLAFDAFYAAMKEWGKYDIVGSPDESDVIVELAYRVEQQGTRVWSTSNTSNGPTQVHSAQIVDPQLMLTIYDGKTKTQLWAETDHRKLARLKKNRDKETVISAQRLVDDLKTRVAIKP
jgi:hypothetical protein